MEACCLKRITPINVKGLGLVNVPGNTCFEVHNKSLLLAMEKWQKCKVKPCTEEQLVESLSPKNIHNQLQSYALPSSFATASLGGR